MVAIDVSADQFSSPGGTISSSRYVDASSVQGSSADLDQIEVRAYSVCISTKTTEEGFTAQVTAPPSTINGRPTPGTGSAGCGPGQFLTGAGFSLAKLTGGLPVTSFYPDERPTSPQCMKSPTSALRRARGSTTGGA
jgi:hypothetical protein